MIYPAREDGSSAERLSEEVNMEGSFGAGTLKTVGVHGADPLKTNEISQAERQKTIVKNALHTEIKKGGTAEFSPFTQVCVRGVFL